MQKRMMCIVPYEELLNKAQNKYKCVQMIVKSARRYEENRFGASTDFRGNIVRAIDDILNDRVIFEEYKKEE